MRGKILSQNSKYRKKLLNKTNRIQLWLNPLRNHSQGTFRRVEIFPVHLYSYVFPESIAALHSTESGI